MAIRTTYTQARASFADLWDKATEEREVIIIGRRGHPDVALIDASELTGLLETVHLLRSPANAQRLLEALEEAESGGGHRMSLDELRSLVNPGPQQ